MCFYRNKKSKYSGNVLFLILLAVALFAALSYAVTQSSRSGGNSISGEQAELFAAQIVQYASNMEQTIQRLRLSNGCRDTQISFNFDNNGNGDYTDPGEDYNNTNSPEDLRCHVFHPNGGNLARPDFDEGMFDSSLEGTTLVPFIYGTEAYSISCVENVGTDTDTNCTAAGDGSAHADLLFILPYIREDVCRALNDRLLGDSAIPEDGGNMIYGNRFGGSFGATAQISNVSGALSACITSDSGTRIASGEYAYYHVLIGR